MTENDDPILEEAFEEPGETEVVDASAHADLLSLMDELETEFDAFKAKADDKARAAIESHASFPNDATVTVDLNPIVGRVRNLLKRIRKASADLDR